MKIRIVFDSSSEIEDYMLDTSILPRPGDVICLSSVSTRHAYPVVRVEFVLVSQDSENRVAQTQEIHVILGPHTA